MVGEYIQSIEVDELWHGGRHARLEFQLGVNVLSGMNGMGKSTIISYIAKGLQMINEGQPLEQYGVKVRLCPEDATSIRYNFIKSFDSPLMSTGQLESITDSEVKTYLDWKLYKLQTNERLSSHEGWECFCDIINGLFSDTGKVIDREGDRLVFFQGDNILSAYKLSAGEKNILIILLTVLLEGRRPCVLLLDEPEICLHLDWQQHLLELILRLNPNVQIILSTHSPGIIKDGWIDKVTEITDSFV